jgi:hypothetical protein
MHGDAGLDQLTQDRLRNVLVVEGDDVDLLCKTQDILAISVVPDGRCGQSGGISCVFGEDPEIDSEVDRRGDHHAGELPASDYANCDAHLFLPKPLWTLDQGEGTQDGRDASD